MMIGSSLATLSRRGAWVLAVPVAALLAAGAAAQTRNPFDSGPLDEKHYNAESRSYFELRSVPPGVQLTWNAANTMARASEYKGVRGRLATVEDSATHEFLRDTFFLAEPAWIGLRFWCGVRKLSWADGAVHAFGAFKAWARPWLVAARGGAACGGSVLTHPVAYTAHARGFLWQAVPAGTRLRYYLVEYPTGGKEPRSADGEAPAPSGVEEAAQQP